MKKLMGLAILLTAVLAVIAYQVYTAGQVADVKLTGYLGGEKIGVMEDTEVAQILQSKYHLKADYTKAGSLEMLTQELADKDYLFPSSQTALQLFQQTDSNKIYKSGIVFNSPIVLYTWTDIALAMEKQGLASQASGYWTVDLPALVSLIQQKAIWNDLGLTDLYGTITIQTTDPNKSNSGNMFAGLVAGILAGGKVIDNESLPQVLPELTSFFARLGYMEHSSSDLFEQYLKTGMGAKPLIAGYENQMIEFAVAHPSDWALVSDRVVVMHPVPTVWNAHPLIALDENGAKLLEAMQDQTFSVLHGRSTASALVSAAASAHRSQASRTSRSRSPLCFRCPRRRSCSRSWMHWSAEPAKGSPKNTQKQPSIQSDRQLLSVLVCI